MFRTPRELSLSQCCYFLPIQPFILNLLRGLFATKRRFGLEFLFSPVTPFLASCSAHANMHTCRTRTPPFHGSFCATAGEAQLSFQHQCVWGAASELQRQTGRKDSGPPFAPALCIWEFLVVSQRNKVGATTHPLCSHVRELAPLLHLANAVCCSSHYV